MKSLPKNTKFFFCASWHKCVIVTQLRLHQLKIYDNCYFHFLIFICMRWKPSWNREKFDLGYTTPYCNLRLFQRNTRSNLRKKTPIYFSAKLRALISKTVLILPVVYALSKQNIQWNNRFLESLSGVNYRARCSRIVSYDTFWKRNTLIWKNVKKKESDVAGMTLKNLL